MSDIQAQFSVLRQTADPAVADAIPHLIEKGEDHELNRINVLDFSKRTGLDEERVISGFLHASRLGLFDLTWNVLCPGCGGVLDAHSTLKSLRHDDYIAHCVPAAMRPRSTSRSRSPSPSARGSGASPRTIPTRCRSGNISSRCSGARASISTRMLFAALTDEVMLDALELPAGEKAVLSLQLPYAIHHRVRTGDACRAVHRRSGRADQGTSAAVADLQQRACADGHHDHASRPAAVVARQSDRRAGVAVGLYRRRRRSII